MSKEKLSVWETLSRIDCQEHVDKKGRFNYLSWAWAWSILKENYPTASFEYKKTDDGKNAFPVRCVVVDEETLEVTSVDDEGFAFVRVAVTVEDQTIEEDLAVMDNYNNDIKNPKPTDINNSLKRCLVKAIALHGLGINVYAGEDTIMFDEPVDKIVLTNDGRKKITKDIRKHMDKSTKTDDGELWSEVVFQHFDVYDVDKFTDEQLVLTHDRIPKLEEK